MKIAALWTAKVSSQNSGHELVVERFIIHHRELPSRKKTIASELKSTSENQAAFEKAFLERKYNLLLPVFIPVL